MIRNLEEKVWEFLKILPPRVHGGMFKRRRAFKYIIAGGTAACVDVGTLFVLKGIVGLSLIPAVSIAFFFGFCASFILQKFWAFEDNSTDRVHAQATMYFIVSGINFFLNLALMYVLVELAHIWYIFAKILVSGGIAFASFFIYRAFIFTQSSVVK